MLRCAAVAALLMAAAHLGAEQQLTVATSRELVAAIGSNRTVTLEPGDYLLSEVAQGTNPAVSWRDAELTITGVTHLTLRSGADTRLLAPTSSVCVLVFVDCHNLTIEGLAAGHSAPEGCSAGVLRFNGCSGVQVYDCELFGSGLVGLELLDCSQVSVGSSTIRGCTGGAIWAEEVQGLRVEDVFMTDNESWPLISLCGVRAAVFASCLIKGNVGGSILWADEDSAGVSFPGTFVRDNVMDSFLEAGSSAADLSQTDMMSNRFAEEMGDDWLLNEEEYPNPYEGLPDDWGYEEGPYDYPDESEAASEEQH